MNGFDTNYSFHHQNHHHHHHRHHHHHLDVGDAGTVFKNVLIILSNLVFIIPGIRCLELKKHVQAFVYFSILVTSSLYHACKFGAGDAAASDGLCLVVDFDVYFVLDHVFATLTIPCLLLSFTPLDVIVFDFRNVITKNTDANPRPGDKKERKRETNSKEELGMFLFENYFSSNTLDFYDVNKKYGHPDSQDHVEKGITTDANRDDDDDEIFIKNRKNSPLLITGYKPVFEITKKNILDFYRKSSRKTIIKSNMIGLENIYICIYAYLITVSLLISYPNFAFTSALCLSSLLTASFWGLHFYIKHGIVTGFKSFDFFFGLALSVLAAILMLVQDHLPSSTYWLTHSIWHVFAALGQWLLLRAKYRFSCYY